MCVDFMDELPNYYLDRCSGVLFGCRGFLGPTADDMLWTFSEFSLPTPTTLLWKRRKRRRRREREERGRERRDLDTSWLSLDQSYWKLFYSKEYLN